MFDWMTKPKMELTFFDELMESLFALGVLFLMCFVYWLFLKWLSRK